MQIEKMKKGVVIAGLSGGTGKSVVAVGLVAAFARKYGRGQIVPFKKGPDYIDSGWLQLAAGRNCYNLDPYLMSRESITNSFFSRFQDARIAVVEGNRGLYDGVNVDGGYSTAELALTLELPVFLVINCSKVTRTVAAMVLGCQKFDERVEIAGVILNEVVTRRQKKLISAAVEKYTGIPVLGSLPRLGRNIFPMRHLGMLPYQEYQDSQGAIDQLADLVEKNIDLSKLESRMRSVDTVGKKTGRLLPSAAKVRIGILRDAAFQFYYSENLEALEQKGAELVTLSAMADRQLPDILDGLYIGGGFPETGAAELAANEPFRKSVFRAAENGLPVYAECGGLIYLGETLFLEGKEYPLVGLFPARFSMAKKPQAHGYSIFLADKNTGFYPKGSEIKGHEFRYSKVEQWSGSDSDLSVKMLRGTGFINGRDGLVKHNTFALYTHIHAEGATDWAKLFVDRCKIWRKEQRS